MAPRRMITANTPSPLFVNPSRAHVANGDRLATILIDTEENFDWTRPIEGTVHETNYLTHIADVLPLLNAYAAIPCFLVTYPVLATPHIVRLLERLASQGRCSLGIQLHSWVTPPFGGESDLNASFPGNFAPDVEARKLATLHAAFVDCFGSAPRIFRAGRYGLGRNSMSLIEQLGIEIDTSLAPRTSMLDQGGPDYSLYDYSPFWFGENRRILQLPLCRSVVGWGGLFGDLAYRWLVLPANRPASVGGALARLRFAERITLSPEGNGTRAMRRLLHALISQGETVLPLSFHSSSLWPGQNPYVRDRKSLHRFFDDLSVTLDYMTSGLGLRLVDVLTLPDRLDGP